MSGRRVAAVIPAGGAGTRMSAGTGPRKQYLELAGEPVLARAIRPFLDHPDIELVVVALPAEDAIDPPAFIPGQVRVVAGGVTRGASVRAALAAVPDAIDVVLVHDAARPMVDLALIDRVLAAVAADAGAIAAIPESDTLKRVRDGAIVETVPRRELWRAQTPQGFPRALLVAAHERAAADGYEGTDDASLVERIDARVVVVEGSGRNIKITTPEDMDTAERLLAVRAGART